MEKNRLEAFSDGVIAIIITIMVLELKIPHGSEWNNLLPLIPVFISYSMSFLFIGIYWGNHHHLLMIMKKSNSRIMLTNLNLLFWLSLIPFATGWMGENHFEANTVALYAVILLLCGVAYTVLQKEIERSIKDEANFKNAMKKVTKKGIISLVAYSISIPVAYFNSFISGFLILMVAIMWLIPDKNIEKVLNK